MRKNVDDVREQAHKEFLRESAGWQVDTSGLPSIRDRQRADAPKKVEKPLAQPYSREYQPRPGALTRSLAQMANQIAADNHDPYRRDVLEALNAVQNDAEGTGITYFAVRGGESVPVDIQRDREGNWFAHIEGKRHSAATRDTLLSAISREVQGTGLRDLTSAEEREISIVCQSQGFYRGVAKYISLRTGGAVDEYEAMSDASVLDPRRGHLYDQACHACWLACHVDFSPDDTWPEFLAVYRGARHLSSGLLDGARCAFEAHKETMARESILSQVATQVTEPQETPPTYAELDALPDDELSRQLHNVKKEYSRLVKTGQI